MRGLVIASVFCVLMLSFVLPKVPKEEEFFLKTEDIHQLMEEVAFQNREKGGDETVFLEAIKAYIDQFDLKRLYLLSSEVAPYLSPKKEELLSWISKHQKKEFVVFHRLNALFQKAIIRNREFRSQFEKERAQFFQKEVKKEGGSETFSGTLEALKERNENALVEFIQEVKSSRGESLVMRSTKSVIEEYNKRLSEAETPYLFEGVDEKPLSKKGREHQFSMFVVKAFAKALHNDMEVLTDTQAKQMRTELQKGRPQVGLQIKKNDSRFFISFLEKDGVAAKSGEIKMNDQLIAVDGVSLEGKEEVDVYHLLKGEEGSSVSLKLKRRIKEGVKYSDKLFTVQLNRMATKGEERVSVKVDTLGNGVIGTIVLNSFYRGEEGISSQADVRNAVNSLKEKYNLKGLVLDLRQNSGGYLTEAIKVAGLFISNGVIATAKYKDGKEVVYRDVEVEKIYKGPLVVLTSKETASAAEIVAQSLQDWGVALVVGDPVTFGKGTIQKQTVTGKEGHAFFKVTVGQYYTVSGKTPQDAGVVADIVVPSLLLVGDVSHESIAYVKHDAINPRFEEGVVEVPEEERRWYMTYYLPHLQTKLLKWKEMIPQLKKNSLGRLAKNKNYQWYLKQHDLPNTVVVSEEDEEEGVKIPRNFGVADIQHEEALNVVKDMIFMEHSEERGLTAQKVSSLN
jgi:carboxyl-terminal processing protease